MTGLRKRISYGLATIVGSLLVLEMILQLLAAVSPSVDSILSRDHVLVPHTIPDEQLGHRPNPNNPEHDANGFRNEVVPDSVDVVCLGDSQTYGTGVPAGDAWPRQLERLCGCSAYSMAFGGYGPTHGLILFGEAVQLKPKIIIQAFYSGNDLFDSFQMVYKRGTLAEYRSDDPSVLEAVEEAESRESVLSRVRSVYGRGGMAPRGRLRSARKILSDYSRLYGLLRASKDAVVSMVRAGSLGEHAAWYEAKSSARHNARYCQLFEGRTARTVLTPEYRLFALNLSDPRMSEALRISLDVIRDMGELAASMNIKFVVLMIPTKEFVFSDIVRREKATVRDSYGEAISNESLLWLKTKTFLDENGIDYVDSAPMLKKVLDAGDQPYPVSINGHPNRLGHEAIAKAVCSKLESLLCDR